MIGGYWLMDLVIGGPGRLGGAGWGGALGVTGLRGRFVAGGSLCPLGGTRGLGFDGQQEQAVCYVCRV